MAVEPGRMLSHYRLIEKIGEGGMGVVWKALDTTLDREVAIKILPDAFSQDPKRLGRFKREAKAVAALNHPNIVTVHTVEDSDGVHFITMELVDGEDLAQRLARGAIPVEEALEIGVQIAEALEAAHEAGVIHRDLKPANIKLTPDDKVKVLDFGLAKALAPDATIRSVDVNPSMSPTLTSVGTVAGVILGTASYMSPEQARGKPVDRRADIWAFGCVLYEMLTGTRPFKGEDVSLTLAEIMKGEPDRDALPPTTPVEIRRLLRRCLTKDPGRRLQAVGDARIEIEEVLSGSGEPVEVKGPRNMLPWVLAVAFALIAFIAGIVSWTMKPAPVPQLVAFPVTVSGGFPDPFYPENVSVSPDGKTLVYAGLDGLYSREIGELVAQPISATQGAVTPAFSSDGKWIFFQRSAFESNVWKVTASGGHPLPVFECECFVKGLSWGPDGTIVFGSYGGGLWRLPATGGDPSQISTLGEDEHAHVHPQVLPSGDAVLFTIWRGALDRSEVGLLVLETGEHRALMAGIHPRYASTGHIVFSRDGALWIRPFDADSLDLGGEARQVLHRIGVDGFVGSALFDISDDGGTLAYLLDDVVQEKALVWVDRNGSSVATVGDPGLYEQINLSPDEKRVAIEVLDQETHSFDIWVLELTTGIMSRLTFDPANDRDPVWSPNGQSVAFTSTRSSEGDIFQKTLGDPGPPITLHTREGRILPEDWSSDYLIYMVDEIPFEIHALSLTDGSVDPILVSRFVVDEPHLSPDGNWIAYESFESSWISQIYIASFPDMNQRQVSRNGGVQPRWRGDGKELFFLSLDGNMMSVLPLESRPPEKLFATGIDARPGIDQYSVTSDGQRFLLAAPADPTTARDRQINVVVNWLEDVKPRD